MGTVCLYQSCIGDHKNTSETNSNPERTIVSDLHTLSIHVRDTITHDSVFWFFIEKLKLPVFYYPETHGERKYSGVFTGNVVLEPCGPFSKTRYTSADFRAIFCGLTYESHLPLEICALELENKNIAHEVVGDQFIYFRDSVMYQGNIFVSIMQNFWGKDEDELLDSLKNAVKADFENELGIEYIKEIEIGYTGEQNLQKWQAFLAPDFKDNQVVHENSVRLVFSQGNAGEVKGILFKVRSLEKAKNYLLENDLLEKQAGELLYLDRTRSFGLTIALTEKN